MRVTMRARGRAGALAAAVVVGAGVWATVGGGGPSGAATLPGGTWGAGQSLPGAAHLQAITCTAPGDCVAVGYSVPGSGGPVPVVVTEAAGTWGSAQPVGGTAGFGGGRGAQLNMVSCGAPGECTAAGSYSGTDGHPHAWYVSETAGAWGTPTAVSEAGQRAGTFSAVRAMSCPAAGYCAIAADYVTITATTSGSSTTVTPFTLDEANSTWGGPQPVPALSSLPSAGGSAQLDSVSCAAPGACTAAGGYAEASGGTQPFVVSETAGTWGSARLVPVTGVPGAVIITSVSCPDAADCTAAGQGFTVDERQGTWGTADQLGNASLASMQTPALACASAGNCVFAATAEIATGPNAGHFIAVADSETSNGGWGALTPVAVPATADSVGSDAVKASCAPGGDCTIVGYTQAAGNPPYAMFAATTANGVLGSARPLPATNTFPPIIDLACPQSGYCTLLGNLSGEPGVFTEANAARVTLTASAATISYGAEQSETLTATVSSAAGGTPTGAVSVTGPAGSTLCTITLANGAGACALTARQLPAGTSTLTARYSGDASYVPASGTTSVTVSQAATATRVSVTPASITFSGAATKLTITGTVSSAAGIPAGATTVRVDGRTIPGCTSTSFTAGTVHCTGTTAILTAGKHNVTLSYSGPGNFAASTSPPVTLTVGLARSSPALTLSRSSVRYGSENTVKFTVAVSHVGSVRPAGKAQVRVGGTTLCMVTLSNSAGSCTLTARQLRAGTYAIIAVYRGDVNYHSSQSTRKTLKVTT